MLWVSFYEKRALLLQAYELRPTLERSDGLVGLVVELCCGDSECMMVSESKARGMGRRRREGGERGGMGFLYSPTRHWTALVSGGIHCASGGGAQPGRSARGSDAEGDCESDGSDSGGLHLSGKTFDYMWGGIASLWSWKRPSALSSSVLSRWSGGLLGPPTYAEATVVRFKTLLGGILITLPYVRDAIRSLLHAAFGHGRAHLQPTWDRFRGEDNRGGGPLGRASPWKRKEAAHTSLVAVSERGSERNVPDADGSL